MKKINMQYYLNDKKLNKIEKQKAEKDGLKIFEELDDYALKGWEEMDEVDLQMRLKSVSYTHLTLPTSPKV